MNSTAIRTTEPPFDRSIYPRTYAPAPAWSVFGQVLAVGLLALGIAALGGLLGWWSMHTHGPAETAAWVMFCGIGLLGGGYVIVAVKKARVTLYADAVELTSYGTPLAVLGLRPPARMTRADIASRTVTHNRGARCLVLRTQNGRKMRLPLIFRTDTAFREWFERIPATRAANRRPPGPSTSVVRDK